MKQGLVYFVLGCVFGFLVYNFFNKPKLTTKVVTVETIKTDTVYVYHSDTVFRNKFIYQYERDTLIEAYVPTIKGFKELYPFPNGNVLVYGETLGELMSMSIATEFKNPVITNTITRDNTVYKEKQPSGLYLAGGLNNQINYSVGAYLVKNKYIFGYDYNPSQNTHGIKIGLKIF
jgi:hypothetical protein